MEGLKKELTWCHQQDKKLAACKIIGNYFDISLRKRKEVCDQYWDESESEKCAENIIEHLKIFDMESIKKGESWMM